MILERLKAETRKVHKDLEKVLDIQRDDLKIEDYKKVLLKFFSIHSGLEERIKNFSSQLDLSDRFKSSRLKDDLNFFKLKTSEKSELIPQIHSQNQLLGYMYVLEGSTLGGMVLGPYFKEKFDLDVGAGLSYFTGYGERTLGLWKEFQEILVQNVLTMESEDKVVESAEEFFNILMAVFKNE